MDLCCYTMVNSVKNILMTKNHLTCDHTTEVLATLIIDYINIMNASKYI